MLVEEDDVLGELSGPIIATDPFGERAEVIADVIVGDGVGLAVMIVSAHVVNPEHVVVLGRTHRASHLGLELFVDDVPDPVSGRELAPAWRAR